MFPVCITGDIDDGREDFDRNIRPLLELLDSYEVKMTVPVTSKALEEHSRKIVAIADAGHEIAGHGDTHTGFRGSIDAQVARLVRMFSDFETRLGLRPRGFRASYLDHNLGTYVALVFVGF